MSSWTVSSLPNGIASMQTYVGDEIEERGEDRRGEDRRGEGGTSAAKEARTNSDESDTILCTVIIIRSVRICLLRNEETAAR